MTAPRVAQAPTASLNWDEWKVTVTGQEMDDRHDTKHNHDVEYPMLI